jgi:hypothetical protein
MKEEDEAELEERKDEIDEKEGEGYSWNEIRNNYVILSEDRRGKEKLIIQ